MTKPFYISMDDFKDYVPTVIVASGSGKRLTLVVDLNNDSVHYVVYHRNDENGWVVVDTANTFKEAIAVFNRRGSALL